MLRFICHRCSKRTSTQLKEKLISSSKASIQRTRIWKMNTVPATGLQNPNQGPCTIQVKKVTIDKVTSTAKDEPAGQQGKSVEEKINDFIAQEKAAAVSDLQTRVLTMKLHILQEELDLLSSDYRKKDDEMATHCAKNKELQDDRARLQMTINIQQTHIEEQNASLKEFVQKCDDLQLRVYTLSKLVRSYEKEVEKMNCQLSETKQVNENIKREENPNVEKLLAENQLLKKQKSELVVGFKKQSRLIDILKKQKMHLEAAKLLSFTEEEFIKAMDLEAQ